MENIWEEEEIENGYRGKSWRVRELNRWLQAICRGDRSVLSESKSPTANDPLLHENLDIPAPLPMRAGRFFWAKTNQTPDPDQARKIFELVEAYGIDRVIYTMSCIPACDFDLEKVHLSCMSPLEHEEYFATLEWNAEIAALGPMGEKGDELTEVCEEDSSDFSWTSDNRIYEYSDYDPDALDSDEFFNERGLPTYDDNWDPEVYNYDEDEWDNEY